MTDWLKIFPADLPTPFVAVDERVFRKNVERVRDYAAAHKLKCCPHFKAHKSLTLARMQCEYGIDHMCVAKVDEGLILSELSLNNIFCTCHPVGEARLKKLASLAARVPTRVPADCTEHIQALAETANRFGVTFEVMLDIDLGLGRTGVRRPAGIETVLREMLRHSSLSFGGVQLYVGNVWGDKIKDSHTYEELNARWMPFVEKIRTAGFSDFTVSVGASPILFESHRIALVNEIRPGALLMGDYWLLSEGVMALEDTAVRVISSVLSAPEGGRSLLDAGTKALCGRSIWGADDRGFARIDQYPEARLFKLHEEIGWVNYSSEEKSLYVGERVSLLPVLIGPTISQYRSLYLYNGSTIVEVAIEGAGALC